MEVVHHEWTLYALRRLEGMGERGEGGNRANAEKIGVRSSTPRQQKNWRTKRGTGIGFRLPQTEWRPRKGGGAAARRGEGGGGGGWVGWGGGGGGGGGGWGGFWWGYGGGSGLVVVFFLRSLCFDWNFSPLKFITNQLQPHKKSLQGERDREK